jgi:hypothetical protein
MNHRENIDRSFDGQLSQKEWDALQQAIITDPDLRREYVEKRWIHALLETGSDALPSLFAEKTPAVAVRAPARPFLWLSAAAALVFFCATLFLMVDRRTDTTVATLVEAKDCRWAGSDLPTVEGSGLGTGTLALMEGMATIQFKSGATVTLEAPGVLVVESAMKCRLVEGSVVADVPESAHGFTIDTPKMEVIDLGTRFGVTTTPLGNSNVFVFEGEVKVREGESPEAKHLFAGHSLVGATNPQPDHDQEVRRSEPLPPPGDDWTPVSTAIGRGRDTYVRRGDDHGPTGGHPLLMVKHTDLAANNERRALLTFDLSTLTSAQIRDARLALKMESSGLGFSSLVPDSRFTVYGIVGENPAGWNEESLLWENAGPLVEEPLSAATARRLATFEIRKGSPNALIETRSDALTEFLRSHPGQLVSLLIVRETGESDKQGLVHAFASKEHPTSPAPTLWIQTAPAE